ncbi:MAG: DegT/DnrJ/EryC1/StrS family aminotransferase [Actinomycetia bacterium]|nr:DegT/DnrJ/EryC1/StrS family aminotransferase [Actinomycetes bacterium]MCP4228396.1 DegT/DnrJ/EryC1/StrS family aminotransferase [Actinomycetes bacterium]MCP5031906.1 DegT/DnrJ/EryC1/StrS family aminotransferase [Actinomycetes bacterium]
MTGVALIDVQAHRHHIGDEIDARIAAVLANGKYIMGPEVAEFERAMEAFIGDEKVAALSCSNGTDALVLGMQALGLSPGQAVICPAFTFVATAESVAALGGIPVFADVEPTGFNLSADSVRQAAKVAQAAGLDVVGICAVDLFGVSADYDGLSLVANELGCWLMADAAQSFGGEVDSAKVGALTSVTTTSFFPAKPLGCYGDGGMVFTTDDALADTIRSLRVHGKGSDKYDNVRIGQNSRLDTIQAAVLLPKLAVLASELDARDRVADRYRTGLDGLVSTPEVPAGYRSAWAQYTLVTERRDELKAGLDEAGIGNAIYYPKPLHWQSGYQHFHLDEIDLDRTEWLTSRVLSLPMHPYLGDDEIDQVIATVRNTLD